MAVSKEDQVTNKPVINTKPEAVKATVAAKPVPAKPVVAKSAPKKTPVAKRAAPKKAVAAKPAPAKLAPAKPAVKMTVAKKVVAKSTVVKPVASVVAAPTKSNVPTIGTDFFTQSFQNNFELPKDQLEEMFNMSFDMFKNYEDVAAFSKSNVDAAVKSGNIFAQGMQTMSTSVVNLFQASMEDSMTNAKAIMECKSAQDLAALQTEIASSAYDKFMAESNKITEATTKVAEEAVAPLTERFNATVEVFNKVKAA